MAEHETHDGRFGERFDDEIRPRRVIEVSIAIAFACALGMLITWIFLERVTGHFEAQTPPPSPLSAEVESRLPPGPLLQADPEAELEAMRHEMAEELGTWGWADEGRGRVRMPIDRAMDLLLAESREGVEEAVE